MISDSEHYRRLRRNSCCATLRTDDVRACRNSMLNDFLWIIQGRVNR